MPSKVDNFSKEELVQMAQSSKTFAELVQKLGYQADSSQSRVLIKKHLDYYGIDISHFLPFYYPKVTKRTPENTFIENSTAGRQTVRKLLMENNYFPYKCSICGLEPEWNGKSLTLILDHINGINNDDRLENLRWVCPNCNSQLPMTGSRNKKQPSSEWRYYCEDCGAKISEGATKCLACYNKDSYIPIKDMKVTREELKNMIRTMTFVDIGKKYNVSDNAIRKWCDKLGLPRRAADIKKYTDAQWAKI